MDIKMDVEEKREFLMRKYQSGVMNGQFILQMPDRQIIAIYENVIKPRKPKVIPGQFSLFEGAV